MLDGDTHKINKGCMESLNLQSNNAEIRIVAAYSMHTSARVYSMHTSARVLVYVVQSPHAARQNILPGQSCIKLTCMCDRSLVAMYWSWGRLKK